MTTQNGDCLTLFAQLATDSIDCIITDPPYGISYKSHKQGQSTRSGKTISTGKEEYFTEIANDESLPTSWLSEAYRVLKDGSAMYVFCHWSTWNELTTIATAVGFKLKNMIVLNKSNWGMGDLKGAYAPKHELLLFATKGRHIMNVPPRLPDVWDVPVLDSRRKRRHPNEKPIDWLLPAIKQSTKEGDTILDPFAGSGSTGAAAKHADRNFILFEIDPEYYKVCIERLK